MSKGNIRTSCHCELLSGLQHTKLCINVFWLIYWISCISRVLYGRCGLQTVAWVVFRRAERLKSAWKCCQWTLLSRMWSIVDSNSRLSTGTLVRACRKCSKSSSVAICISWMYHCSPTKSTDINGAAISILRVYSVSQKSFPQKNFLRYFLSWWTCIIENYLGYCPNIFLCLYQFWSIYLNICVKCNVTFLPV